MEKWMLMMSDRTFFPQELAGSRDGIVTFLEVLTYAKGRAQYRVEAMTDQVDVYAGDRKVAVYMVGG